MTSQFTKEEQACIDLQVPYSGTPWLDDLIKQAIWMKSFRDSYHQLVSLNSGVDESVLHKKVPELAQKNADNMTDALLKQIGEPPKKEPPKSDVDDVMNRIEEILHQKTTNINPNITNASYLSGGGAGGSFVKANAPEIKKLFGYNNYDQP